MTYDYESLLAGLHSQEYVSHLEEWARFFADHIVALPRGQKESLRAAYSEKLAELRGKTA